MYRDKKMDERLKEFKEADDFVIIHYQEPFGPRESLVSYLIQDRRMPKHKEWSKEKEKWLYYWPGISLQQVKKLIRTYSKGELFSDSFHCLYRARHTEHMEEFLKENIPEANLESV